MTISNAVTPKQAETLNYIRAFQKSHGFSPTLQEIADAALISKTSAYARVLRLISRGVLAKVGAKNTTRNYVLLEESTPEEIES